MAEAFADASLDAFADALEDALDGAFRGAIIAALMRASASAMAARKPDLNRQDAKWKVEMAKGGGGESTAKDAKIAKARTGPATGYADAADSSF